jgi:hypothetical protein
MSNWQEAIDASTGKTYYDLKTKATCWSVPKGQHAGQLAPKTSKRQALNCAGSHGTATTNPLDQISGGCVHAHNTVTVGISVSPIFPAQRTNQEIWQPPSTCSQVKSDKTRLKSHSWRPNEEQFGP